MIFLPPISPPLAAKVEHTPLWANLQGGPQLLQKLRVLGVLFSLRCHQLRSWVLLLFLVFQLLNVLGGGYGSKLCSQKPKPNLSQKVASSSTRSVPNRFWSRAYIFIVFVASSDRMWALRLVRLQAPMFWAACGVAFWFRGVLLWVLLGVFWWSLESFLL